MIADFDELVLPMTKDQLIDEILDMNPSADVAFLQSFGPNALERYYQHLLLLREPRGRNSTWVRIGDTPAMVMAEA